MFLLPGLACHKPYNSCCLLRQEDLTPSIERAIKVYAAEHNMPIDKVTPQMVKSSELGLEYYACKGLDTSARGAAGQALNRAMDKSPHVKHEIYKWLSEGLKKKFRTSWAIERSFEKVCKQRTRVLRNLRCLFE